MPFKFLEKSQNHEKILQEKISVILGIPIDSYNKILIILVLLGKKKASDLTFPDNVDASKLKAILQNLRKINLQADIIRTDTKRKNIAIGVSQSKAIIEELKTLNPDKDHRRFGELMGFPDSAIDAFTGGAEKATTNAQLEAMKDLPRPRDFPFFGFSKNNMELELQQVKSWVALIQQYAPELLIESPKI